MHRSASDPPRGPSSNEGIHDPMPNAVQSPEFDRFADFVRDQLRQIAEVGRETLRNIRETSQQVNRLEVEHRELQIRLQNVEREVFKHRPPPAPAPPPAADAEAMPLTRRDLRVAIAVGGFFVATAVWAIEMFFRLKG